LRSKLLAVLIALSLTGCYSVVTINFASISRSANTAGPPAPPEVQCAALVASQIKIRIKANINPIDLCREVLDEAEKKKEPKK
jgi:hypothetical protein